MQDLRSGMASGDFGCRVSRCLEDLGLCSSRQFGMLGCAWPLDPESPNSKFGKPLMGPCPSHSLDWVAVKELKASYHPGSINICIYSQC